MSGSCVLHIILGYGGFVFKILMTQRPIIIQPVDIDIDIDTDIDMWWLLHPKGLKFLKDEFFLHNLPYDITYMWNLKYDTNEHIHKTKTDSQIQRTDLCLPRGTGGGGRKH